MRNCKGRHAVRSRRMVAYGAHERGVHFGEQQHGQRLQLAQFDGGPLASAQVQAVESYRWCPLPEPDMAVGILLRSRLPQSKIVRSKSAQLGDCDGLACVLRECQPDALGDRK